MDDWREQVRFGKKVQVPPMDEWAVLVHDPLDCYQIGLRFYSGAVIDTLVLNCWADGTRFKTGDTLYEVKRVDDCNSVLVAIKCSEQPPTEQYHRRHEPGCPRTEESMSALSPSTD